MNQHKEWCWLKHGVKLPVVDRGKLSSKNVDQGDVRKLEKAILDHNDQVISAPAAAVRPVLPADDEDEVVIGEWIVHGDGADEANWEFEEVFSDE